MTDLAKLASSLQGEISNGSLPIGNTLTDVFPSLTSLAAVAGNAVSLTSAAVDYSDGMLSVTGGIAGPWSVLGKAASLDSLQFGLQALNVSGSTAQRWGATLSCQVTLGGTYTATISLTSAAWTLAIRSSANSAVPTVSDLGKSLGLSTAADAFASALTKLGFQDFTVTDVALAFSPTAGKVRSVSIAASLTVHGHTFNVVAYLPSLQIRGSCPTKGLTLDSVAKSFDSHLSLPANQLDQLRLGADLSVPSFSIGLLSEQQWTIPLEPIDVVLEYVEIAAELSDTPVVTLIGQAKIAGLDTYVNSTIPGEFHFFGALPTVKIRDLLTGLGRYSDLFQPFDDIQLNDSTVRLDHTPQLSTLRFQTDVVDFGFLSIVVQSNPTGVAAGFAVPDTWRPSAISGFPKLLDAFSFSNTAVAASSYSCAASLLGAGFSMIPSGTTLSEGIAVYSTLGFDQGQLSSVAKILMLGQISVSVSLTIQLKTLSATLTAAIPVRNNEIVFSLTSDDTVAIKSPHLLCTVDSEPTLTVGVSANVVVTLHKVHLPFNGTIELDNDELKLILSTTQPWPDPFGLQNLVITGLGISLGLSVEGVSELGFSGSFALKGSNVTGDIAVTIDVANPQQSEIKGDLNNITVGLTIKTGPIVVGGKTVSQGLDFSPSATASVSIDAAANDFSVGLSCTFDFQKQPVTVDFSLLSMIADLANLASAIEKYVADNASQIFGKFFNPKQGGAQYIGPTVASRTAHTGDQPLAGQRRAISAGDVAKIAEIYELESA